MKKPLNCTLCLYKNMDQHEQPCTTCFATGDFIPIKNRFKAGDRVKVKDCAGYINNGEEGVVESDVNGFVYRVRFNGLKEHPVQEYHYSILEAIADKPLGFLVTDKVRVKSLNLFGNIVGIDSGAVKPYHVLVNGSDADIYVSDDDLEPVNSRISTEEATKQFRKRLDEGFFDDNKPSDKDNSKDQGMRPTEEFVSDFMKLLKKHPEKLESRKWDESFSSDDELDEMFSMLSDYKEKEEQELIKALTGKKEEKPITKSMRGPDVLSQEEITSLLMALSESDKPWREYYDLSNSKNRNSEKSIKDNTAKTKLTAFVVQIACPNENMYNNNEEFYLTNAPYERLTECAKKASKFRKEDLIDNDEDMVTAFLTMIGLRGYKYERICMDKCILNYDNLDMAGCTITDSKV